MKRTAQRTTKLNAEMAKEIRRESQQNPKISLDALGRRYGVSVTTITAILKGKIWKESPGPQAT